MKEAVQDSRGKGPLAGVRVLELARLYPGPLAGMILAGWGAEVIKVEDPDHPDPMRFYPPYLGEMSAGFLAVNRHKKSLAVRFHTPAGRSLLQKLVAQADVLIESFRPGFLARWGLDYQSLRQVNPRLIYASVTGYGQKGPYAQRAGHDLNYIALSGILGDNRDGAGRPVIPGIQIGDVAGGAYLTVMAVLAALVERQRTGQGRWLDVAMLDGLLPFTGLHLAHRAAGLEAHLRPLSGSLACYNVYRCKDGKFVALAALETKFWQQFCQLIEHPEWIDRQFEPGQTQTTLKQNLQKIFQQKTREAWVALAADADVCLTPVLDLDELGEDPHLGERGLFYQQMVEGNPLLVGTRPPVFPPEEDAQAPALGEHSRSILHSLGLGEKEIQKLLQEGTIVQAAGD
ncbi:MAG: CoA transferase [Calditrichaeota bacterium]|nr:MAG: CoA transferase [Calditrichota bacterium]